MANAGQIVVNLAAERVRYTPEIIDRAIVALSNRLNRRDQPYMDKLDKLKYTSKCMRNIAQHLAEEQAQNG